MKTKNRWMALGTGLLLGVLVTAIVKNLIPFSEPEGRTTAPIAKAATESEQKWAASQKATLSALTKANDFRAESIQATPCADAYEGLAALPTAEIMTRILQDEAEISPACTQVFASGARTVPVLLGEIKTACALNAEGSACVTPLVELKSKLIDVGTRDLDPESLPLEILLSKVFARVVSNDTSPNGLLNTLALIDELESRDENLGFEHLRIYILSDLARHEKSHLEEFEKLATSVANPEDGLAYRFKYNLFEGDLAKTELIVKEHLEKHPQSAQANYFLAIVEYKRGNIPSAQTYASLSAQLDPTNSFFKEQAQSLKDSPETWQTVFTLPTVTYNFGS